MKLIKISTDLEMTVHEFPSGSHEEQNKCLVELIGNDCKLFEHVMPIGLYKKLGMEDHPTSKPGQCVSMLVDEEGLLKENEPNLVGSYLYGTGRHGHPIMGNVLFVGEKWSDEGIDFCGIEDAAFEKLELQLNNMIHKMKEVEEALYK